MYVLLMLIKYFLIIVLYIFIIKVFSFMIKDLKQHSDMPSKRDNEFMEGAELVIIESKNPLLKPGTIVKLGSEAIIGRGKQCDIQIPDSFISSNHARIFSKNDRFFLEDLDSINGTFLNDKPVEKPVLLRHKDIIKISGVTFKFVRWKYEME